MAQVLSPGPYRRIADAGPLVFVAGASFVPELRPDEPDGRDAALRFNAFLAVDVTLFPL